nr:general secretion pathway protein GspK [Candidatus Omnitrophota bacterium]
MKSKKASILIFVMWALIILSLLSITVSYNSAADIKLAKYESLGIKSLYLAKAGIAKMIIELNKDKNNYDSLNEDWNKEREFILGGSKVIYRACDEGARLNLNSSNLNKEYLIRLGLDDDVCQGLLGYRIKKGEKGFEFMEELFLIDGMTRDIYLSIKDYMTIYRGLGSRVNINTADENILKIVLGDDTLMINKIITYKEGNDGEICTEDDGIFTEDNFSFIFENFGVTPEAILNYQTLFDVSSGFFRILADASFSEDKSQMKSVTAIVDKLGKIYYWEEE